MGGIPKEIAVSEDKMTVACKWGKTWHSATCRCLDCEMFVRQLEMRVKEGEDTDERL